MWQCSICLEAQLQSFLLSFWRQLVYFGFMGSLGKKKDLKSFSEKYVSLNHYDCSDFVMM